MAAVVQKYDAGLWPQRRGCDSRPSPSIIKKRGDNMSEKKIVESIKGFKFVRHDMTSEIGVHTWQLGKWYKIEGDLSVCINGFHASETLIDAFYFTHFSDNRLFIVEGRGEVQYDCDKFCTSEMRLLEEVSQLLNTKRFVEYCNRRLLRLYRQARYDYTKDDIRRTMRRITQMMHSAVEERCFLMFSWAVRGIALSMLWAIDTLLIGLDPRDIDIIKREEWRILERKLRLTLGVKLKQKKEII